MSPQDHNKTLGIIYSFLGGVLALAALVMLINSFTKERTPAQPLFNEPFPKDSFITVMIPIAIFLAIFLLLTAYGLFRKIRWARISALILACIFIWIFPLGTILAAYTWWFMHSEGAKRLYANSPV
jgi:hypothetical protein